MTLTKIVVVLGAVLLLPLGWELLNSGSVNKLFSAPPSRPVKFQFDNGSATPGSSVSRDASRPATRVNKCMNGPSVIYMDEPCPAGTQGQTMVDESKAPAPGVTSTAVSPKP